MQEIMLKIDNVSKKYKLGQIGGTTLRDEIQRKIAKLKHKEDPTKKIGTADFTKGETFMALNGVSFEVKKGERVGIIGHNGAGKSTLLKLISRVTAPTGGTISMNGRVASMLEVGTGFHGELTGRENIYMNGAILGMTKKEIDAKMDDIIEFSECRQFIDTPVKRYSSGMYVKLAFSVAAHLDSEIMIMDEVLAVGDMAFQKKCLTKMNDVSRQDGRTILYVSHNMNTIRQLCDRCIVLNHGKVVFDGDVEKAISIYFGQDQNHDTHFDFYSEERKREEFRSIQMLSLDILEKNTSVFKRGEILKFNLHCNVLDSFKDLSFRFEIFASGSIAGTAFGDTFFSGQKGELIDIEATFDTINLVPCEYTVVALIYSKDEYGNEKYIDRVEPALIFSVENIENNDINWLPQYWGYTRYNDIKIQNVKHFNV